MTVLVTAASKYGATQEIAAAIGAALGERGIDVDVRRIEDAPSPSEYEAVVLGSAVYAGRWPEPARRFVAERGGELAERPTWLFSSGLIGDPPRPEAAKAVQIDELLAASGAREHRARASCVRGQAGPEPPQLRRAGCWSSRSARRTVTFATGTRSQSGPARSRPHFGRSPWCGIPAARFRAAPDVRALSPADSLRMDSGFSYAICWREGDGPIHVGRLEVHEGYLAFEGPQHLSIAVDEIVGVRIGRLVDERIRGLPSLVVERAGGVPVNVTSPVGFGAVQELAQLLGAAGSKRAGHPLSVVVVGGGVAALEAVVALRSLAEERVAITLVSASPRFSYRPLAVAQPFDTTVPAFDLAELAAGCGADLVVDTVVSVDVTGRTIATGHSGRLAYDVLLVATGARPRAAIPGASTFWDGQAAEAFESLLAELSHGVIERLVFAVPPRTVWPLPLYELALQTSARLAELGAYDVALTFVTPEETPLALFGREAGDALARLFENRGIELLTRRMPVTFENGALRVVPNGAVRADRVVSVPRLVGARLDGLPADDAGFLLVDRYGHVRGVPDVFAAGDATTLPVKQGRITAQQADAVAETIAARAGAEVLPTPFRPVLRAMLLTGSVPLFFRTELGGGRGETAVVADEPLWWPPGKIAARYLGPYLAARELDSARDP